MKTIRFLLSLFLAALLLAGLSGCAKYGAASAISSAGNNNMNHIETEPRKDETNFAHKYRSAGGTTLAECGSVLYFVIGKHLGYYDGDTGASGPLCGRPECDHTDWTCDAYVNQAAQLFACEGGKLYWLGVNQQFGHVRDVPMQYGIWRADPDGTNRELLAELPEEITENGTVYEVTLYRGKIYMNVRELLVQNGVPENRFCLYETELGKDGEFWRLLEFDDSGSYQLAENYAYVLTFADPGSETTPPHGPEIARYDLDTGKTELLLPADQNSELAGTFFVGSDLSVFFSDTRMNVSGDRLYKLADGALEPVPGTRDETGGFSVLYLTEGLAYCNHWTPNGEEIWLRDFFGNTLYKGPWEMGFREKNASETMPIQKAFLGGGQDRILFCFKDILSGVAYVVQYDISPEGLSETLLWSWSFSS